jgi:hypothetical protein
MERIERRNVEPRPAREMGPNVEDLFHESSEPVALAAIGNRSRPFGRSGSLDSARAWAKSSAQTAPSLVFRLRPRHASFRNTARTLPSVARMRPKDIT